jgi:Fur family ferric uptake transcriptional regulator
LINSPIAVHYTALTSLAPKTSVYRALEQLETENAICRHHFNEDEAVFELSDHEHIHLVCNNCGKVTSSESNLTQSIALDGFTVEHQHITLIGKCQGCVGVK